MRQSSDLVTDETVVESFFEQLASRPTRQPDFDRIIARGRRVRIAKKGFALLSAVAIGLIVLSVPRLTRSGQDQTEVALLSSPGWSDAEAAALREVSANYGDVTKVDVRSETSYSEWAALEPNNAASVDGLTADERLVALFVLGDFEVVGPIAFEGGKTTQHRVKYSAGRILVTSSGKVLQVQLWPAARDARPAFGSQFDDQ